MCRASGARTTTPNPRSGPSSQGPGSSASPAAAVAPQAAGQLSQCPVYVRSSAVAYRPKPAMPRALPPPTGPAARNLGGDSAGRPVGQQVRAGKCSSTRPAPSGSGSPGWGHPAPQADDPVPRVLWRTSDSSRGRELFDEAVVEVGPRSDKLDIPVPPPSSTAGPSPPGPARFAAHALEQGHLGALYPPGPPFPRPPLDPREAP